MFAAGIGAFAARRLKDEGLAANAWFHLLVVVRRPDGYDGYNAVELRNTTNRVSLREIPWVTTNTTAQWRLNTIMCLEFIREQLPEDMEAVLKVGAKAPYWNCFPEAFRMNTLLCI